MKTQSTAAQALLAARNELAKEDLAKSVDLYKVKLRSLSAANTVVANIEREIADLELAIEQGNV